MKLLTDVKALNSYLKTTEEKVRETIIFQSKFGNSERFMAYLEGESLMLKFVSMQLDKIIEEHEDDE